MKQKLLEYIKFSEISEKLVRSFRNEEQEKCRQQLEKLKQKVEEID